METLSGEMMKKGIKTKGMFVSVLWVAALSLSISPVLAQDGTSVPKEELPVASSSPRATTSVSMPQVASSTPATAENPMPGAISPRPATSELVPVSEPTSIPVVPDPVPTKNQPVLSVADPINSPQPENSRGNTLAFAAMAGLAVLGGYGIYKLQTSGNSQNKNTHEEKDEESRCLNLKKLMEEKFEELTDLKGQLGSKAKEQIRGQIKKVIEGTHAAEAVAFVERAEKEYKRLEQLYNKCIIELQMEKRVFLVHGWDGFPENAWFPWLKRELEQKGFQVEAPAMPESESPKIGPWVSHLASVVGEVDENTFFVGHSIGCQTIIRYLESLPTDKKVGGAVFVAGFFTLMNVEHGEATEIARPWLETPIACEKVKQHTEKFFALFSDNDHDVPISNKELFEQRLGAETAVEHDKGHFSESDGIKEIRVVLEKVLGMLSDRN